MTEQSCTGRWRTNEDFMLRTIAGESVLIPIGNVQDPRFDNCMITLNDTAAFLWQLFTDAPRTEAEAVAAAEDAFSAPDGVIAAHIREFITAYANFGLLCKEN